MTMIEVEFPPKTYPTHIPSIRCGTRNSRNNACSSRPSFTIARIYCRSRFAMFRGIVCACIAATLLFLHQTSSRRAALHGRRALDESDRKFPNAPDGRGKSAVTETDLHLLNRRRKSSIIGRLSVLISSPLCDFGRALYLSHSRHHQDPLSLPASRFSRGGADSVTSSDHRRITKIDA